MRTRAQRRPVVLPRARPRRRRQLGRHAAPRRAHRRRRPRDDEPRLVDPSALDDLVRRHDDRPRLDGATPPTSSSPTPTCSTRSTTPTPDTTSEGGGTRLRTAAGDGIWYFHVRRRELGGHLGRGRAPGGQRRHRAPSMTGISSSTHGSQSTLVREQRPGLRLDCDRPGSRCRRLLLRFSTRSPATTPDTTARAAAPRRATATRRTAPGTSTCAPSTPAGSALEHDPALHRQHRHHRARRHQRPDQLRPPGAGDLVCRQHAAAELERRRQTPLPARASPATPTSSTRPPTRRPTQRRDGGTSYTSGARADGIWYFHVCAVDGAGNTGAVSHYTLNIDTTAPSAISGLASSTTRCRRPGMPTTRRC